MKPAAFTYHSPATLPEVLELLCRHGSEAKVIAGGQSLVPMMNLRMASPAHLIELPRLPDLEAIAEDDGGLVVGALARHAEVAASPLVRRNCPVIAEAVGGVANYVVRAQGTIGGSLAHADPAAQYPLLVVALAAEIRTLSPAGERVRPAGGFFEGPMMTALGEDEIVTAVRFPRMGPNEAGAFRMMARRPGDFPLAAVAATVTLGDGRIRSARLGMGAVADVPHALAEAAGLTAGRDPTAAGWADDAADCAAAAVVDDGPGVPAAYRRDLVRTLARRALIAAAARAGAAS